MLHDRIVITGELVHFGLPPVDWLFILLLSIG